LKGPAKFIRPLCGVLFDSVAFNPALSTSESGLKTPEKKSAANRAVKIPAAFLYG